MTQNRLTCNDCDELLSAYFENDLDDAARADFESHAASCARCHGLIADIDGIRTEAASLRDIVPSKDLWRGIESRIQPAVVSVSARHERAGMSRRMLVAAAAALVVAASGVTYVATSRTFGEPESPRRVVDEAKGIRLPGPISEALPSTPRVAADLKPSVGSIERSGTLDASVLKPLSPGRVRGSQSSGRGSIALATLPTAAMTASEKVLSSEIATLQAIVTEKRARLDPATVRVVEDNLNLIDVAVKQARAALARDPASGFLTGTLDNVLQKKVELLRTVALLASRS